jgi:stress response protein SCP2
VEIDLEKVPADIKALVFTLNCCPLSDLSK